VQAQTYPNVEHVIVSDGPAPGLWEQLEPLATDAAIAFDELPTHDDRIRWGVRARLAGERLASGAVHFWLDDDNSYRPGHVAKLMAAFAADPAIGFAYSRIQFNGHADPYFVGNSPPFHGGVDTSAIANRPAAYRSANWRAGQPTIDWDLVERWMAMGLTWAFVDEVTADYFMTPWPDHGVTAIPLEADVSYQLTVAGHVDGEDAERDLAERLREVLSDPASGVTASQLSGAFVNGPVHQPVTEAKGKAKSG
jgi:hypothetical protein